MSRVRLAAADPERRGGWIPVVDARLARLESAVRSVLESSRDALADADRVTIVPDAHYPFHPSTGMVTDPAVVGAVTARLDQGTDVAVAGATDERITFGRTAAYLGYDDLLARFDVDLVDLADDGVARTDAVGHVDGRTFALSIPERLLESTVVVAPTLRPTGDGAVAGAMRTLAATALLESPVDPAPAAVAATRAIDPELAVLDATTAYGDDPVAADALFAGPVPAVDAVGASLLDRSPEDDDALALALGDDGTPVRIDNPDDVDVAAIGDRLANGQLPPADETHPAVSTAYRLYAATSGDAVPPQIEGGR